MSKMSRSALALLGLGCALAAGTPCYVEIAGKTPVVRHMDDAHERISLVLPEFDASQEFLFHFYPDGHSVFYAGGLFQESASNEPKVHKTIAHGMGVRVRVGPEAIARIVDALKAGVIAKAIRYYTCHQRLLLVLHAAGIYPARGPALFGTTLINGILEEGFVDGARNAYPHEIYVLNRDGEDHFRTVRHNIQTYELGGAHNFWGGILAWMEYSHADMLEDVTLYARDPELLRALAYVPSGGDYNEFPQDLRDRAHDVLQAVERKLVADIEGVTGQRLQDWLPAFLEHGADDKRAWVRERFRVALAESLQAH